MGIMQTEIQEKRGWIEKKEFAEGLALVNMLPGPGATQLGIYLGHSKAGLGHSFRVITDQQNSRHHTFPDVLRFWPILPDA
jgi:chromate transport protein ChrA